MKFQNPQYTTSAELEALRQRIAVAEETLAKLRVEVPELFNGEAIAKQLEQIRMAKLHEAVMPPTVETDKKQHIKRKWRLRLPLVHN